MAERLLEVKDLKVQFATEDGVVNAVDGVSFTLDRGQVLGIVGESGSGKSVTSMTMLGLTRGVNARFEGEVNYKGRDLIGMSEDELQSVRGNEIAMIFQDPMTSLNPVYRVGSQIAEGLRAHNQGMNKHQARARGVELLRAVGIPNPEARVDDYPHQFSGGMRQRVMIAMAICTNPDVLIADEPTTALDVTTQARIMELLGRIVEERRMGVILITHDLGLASSFCEDIHVMYGGRIVESGPAPAVLNTPVHPYSEALLESICRLDRDVHRPIAAISGQPPLPHQLPSGCPFHPRCAYAQDVCVEVPPPPIPVDGRVTECHFPLEEARP